MKSPTVERCIETRFFKKHRKHMPAVINITPQEDAAVEKPGSKQARGS
ncbi:MAG: hypothetical protein PHG85_00255 [Candidatus Altiarchaeota archaeon]|nr:hypothetical protein [Candidatus Altiarchaeota archaeon]